ncbi:MAG: triphosphoribosyl-dephospho-CoA synthase, partial [Synergistaceae bacterium]|nr:triphosphoribosyl-dephospho-CoA synthase [Synergistaceae bacterium]
ERKTLGEIFIFNIAKLAVKAIINTASVYPKPGLITPIDNSALDGTDFPCLLDGAMSLFQCFVNCASVGIETENVKPEDAFTVLQGPAKIGVNDALTATRGKLRMKGFVFSLGLLSAAAGRLIKQKRFLTPAAITLTASSFVRGITQRELWALDETNRTMFTLGEKSWKSYGLEGLRGEAEHGFKQTLRALETLRSLDANYSHLTLREKCTHALINIIAEIQDTTIAGRGGITELMRVQDEAKSVINQGGMLTTEGIDAVFEFDNNLRSRGTAPNGSMIILANALFIPDLVKLRLTRSGYDE